MTLNPPESTVAHKNRWTVNQDTKSDSFVIAFAYVDEHGVARRYRKSAGRGLTRRQAEERARALYLEMQKDPTAFVERFVTRAPKVHTLPTGPSLRNGDYRNLSRASTLRCFLRPLIRST